MPVLLRSAALAAALALSTLAPAAWAQTPCTGGTVTAGGETFACDGVDFYARLAPTELGAPPLAGCPTRACLNDLWGWTDPLTGREYALVGVSNGTAFVDVTVPAAPRRLGVLPTATSPSTWRDVKTYGTTAYVVSEAFGHGLQVFDLRRLRRLGEDPDRVFQPDARITDFGSTHNVVVDEDAGRVIAVGGACGSGLQTYTLEDPLAPAFAGCSGGTGYIHDAQCLVYDGPDPDYAGRNVCVGFNNDSVFVLDATDPANVTRIATGVYPGSRYAHQGWLTDDRRYLLINDEADEGDTADRTRTILFDVQDLDDPEFLGFYLNPSTTTVDHNLYVRGRLAYQANYNNGLRILNLARVGRAQLREVAFFDTFPGPPDGFQDPFDGAWSVYPFFESGTVVVSDQIYGLFVLRLAPATQQQVTAMPDPTSLAATELTLDVRTPARGAARATFSAPAGEPVRVALYDLRGRELGVLFDGPAAGTPQHVTVDGEAVAAGVVIVRAETAEGHLARRLTFVR